MLAQNDQERELYEARRKAQLDYNTDIKVARMQGRAEGRDEGRVEGRVEGLAQGRVEGRQEGIKIGQIQMLERILNHPETSIGRLLSLSLADLTQLAESLQNQVLKRQ